MRPLAASFGCRLQTVASRTNVGLLFQKEALMEQRNKPCQQTTEMLAQINESYALEGRLIPSVDTAVLFSFLLPQYLT